VFAIGEMLIEFLNEKRHGDSLYIVVFAYTVCASYVTGF